MNLFKERFKGTILKRELANLKQLIRICWAVIVCGGVMIMLAGCGLKSDPRIPPAARPGAIQDLTVTQSTEGAVLKWTMPGDKSKIAKFRIIRGEIAADCPSCPPKYLFQINEDYVLCTNLPINPACSAVKMFRFPNWPER